MNDLCHKTDLTDEEQVRLYDLQNQLDNLYLEKAKGAFVRSRARWLEEGEKNTTYFFSLEKQRQTKKKIQQLLISNTLIDNQSQVNEEITTFYRTLYQSKFSSENCNIFFEKIRGYKKKHGREFSAIYGR